MCGRVGGERPWMTGCHGYAACPTEGIAAGVCQQFLNPPSQIRTRAAPPMASIPIPSRKLTAEQNRIRKAKVAR